MRTVATVSTLSYQTVQLITEKLTCLGPEVSHVDNIRDSSERITSDRVAWWPFDHIFFPILSFRDREDRRPDPRGTLSACFSGFPSRESSSASSTTSHDLTTLFPCWNWVVSWRFLLFSLQFIILIHAARLYKSWWAIVVNVPGVFPIPRGSRARVPVFARSTKSCEKERKSTFNDMTCFKIWKWLGTIWISDPRSRILNEPPWLTSVTLSASLGASGHEFDRVWD